MTRDSSPELAPPVPAWAESLARLMDEAIRIPGSNVRVGLDAILGFVLPGLGDAASSLVSLSLFIVAFQLRVPKVVVLRMLMNVAFDTLIGSLPVLGDALDIFYRANQKNLALLRHYERKPLRRADLGDTLFVIGGLSLVVALAFLPLGLVIFVWSRLRR